MDSISPLLIGAFAFNFNNFTLIFLLTSGGPPIVGADVAVGYTDILISFTYDLAIAGGRGYQFGLAASVTTIIFFIVLIISAISFFQLIISYLRTFIFTCKYFFYFSNFF